MMLRSVLGSRMAVLAELFVAPNAAPVRPALVTGAGTISDLVGQISSGWWWPWGREAENSSILEAAPKKRTSHQKKRQRQLAGNNQQKPLRNLNRCPSCGHYKRAHTLCMNCVREIQSVWRARDKAEAAAKRDPTKHYDPENLSPQDTEFNYPERVTKPSEYERKLADRESYVPRRPRTLPVPLAKPQKPKRLPLELRKKMEL